MIASRCYGPMFIRRHGVFVGGLQFRKLSAEVCTWFPPVADRPNRYFLAVAARLFNSLDRCTPRDFLFLYILRSDGCCERSLHPFVAIKRPSVRITVNIGARGGRVNLRSFDVCLVTSWLSSCCLSGYSLLTLQLLLVWIIYCNPVPVAGEVIVSMHISRLIKLSGLLRRYCYLWFRCY